MDKGAPAIDVSAPASAQEKKEDEEMGEDGERKEKEGNCVLLAIGIYTQVESELLRRVELDTVLTSPGMVLIILSGVIFIVSLCGYLRALR